MKNSLCVAALALSLSAVIPAGAGDPVRLNDFLELEQKMSDALLHGDGPGFATQVVDDWKIVLANAKVLTLAEVTEPLASGKLKFRFAKISDVEVRAYGDTAIVVGVNETKGSWGGQDFAGRDRFTDVFMREDRVWKCVASHSTRIEAE
jgi:hypothetical protein